MAKEELEKEAGEYAKPFYNMTRYDYVEERTHIKEAYLAGAEPREKRIAELKEQVEALANVNIKAQNIIGELKAQIEKMKCCCNCDNYCQCKNRRCNGCHNFSHWKLKEDD